MNIVHSFYSVPSLMENNSLYQRNNGSYNSEKIHSKSWALSCLTWKKYYGKIILYTDKKGKEWLIDKLQLPYDEVYVVLDYVQEYLSKYNLKKNSFYAFSKLYVYNLQNEPFLHVDGDTYIWDKLPFEINQYDIIAQNIENNINIYESSLEEIKQFFNVIPDFLIENNDLPLKAVNAGIMGGNDISFFKRVYSEVTALLDNNKKNLSSVNLDTFNCLMEQFVLYKISKNQNQTFKTLFDEVITPVNSFKEFTKFENIPYLTNYIHLISYAKSNFINSVQIELRLDIEFPKINKHIDNVYKDLSDYSIPISFIDNQFKLTSETIKFNYNQDIYLENEIESFIENNLSKEINEKILNVYSIYQIECFKQKKIEHKIKDSYNLLRKNLINIYYSNKDEFENLKFKLNKNYSDIIFLNTDDLNININTLSNNIIMKNDNVSSHIIYIKENWKSIDINISPIKGIDNIFKYLEKEYMSFEQIKNSFNMFEDDKIINFLLINTIINPFLIIKNKCIYRP